MTDAELDEWRAKAAFDADRNRTWQWAQLGPDYRATIILAGRLARENWQPTDPDLLLAREVVAAEHDTEGWTRTAAQFRAGEFDDAIMVRVALAAIRATRGEAG